jgi:hypothetical protein
LRRAGIEHLDTARVSAAVQVRAARRQVADSAFGRNTGPAAMSAASIHTL